MTETRTTATISGDTYSGLGCADCGTTYARCTERVLKPGGAACCSGCRNRETHDERHDRPAPTYLEPLHDELDRLRTENAELGAKNEDLLALLVELKPSDEVLVEGFYFPRDDLPRILGNYMRAVNEEASHTKAFALRAEQAEARVDQLTDQLTLANDTLRHRGNAVNATGHTNDQLRATIARIEKIADTWDGYGHGVYNIHPAKSLPCSVCDLLNDVRIALTLNQEPARD